MEATYCSNCGSKNSKESKFCGSCGEKISIVVIEKNSCLGCGYVANEDEKYCPDCGTALTSGNSEEKTAKPQPKPEKKKKSRPIAKTTLPLKKKKGGILRTLGKVALWIFGILIVLTTILYYMGDDPDTQIVEDQKITEETIADVSEDEMKLPPIEVTKANAKLSGTSTFQVVQKNEPQEFSFGDNIKVSLPPNFTNKEKSLSISNAEIDKTVMVEGTSPLLLIDLTLNRDEQPDKPVELAFKYDTKELNPFSAEERLEAFRWDEEGGSWVKLPIRIDEKENTVYAYVDHFSLIGFIVVKALKVGGAYAGAVIAEEKILNDTYFTPEKNFKILYSKRDILKDADLNTKEWKRAKTGRNITNKSTAPPYIQASGYHLEEALKSYTGGKNGFKNPTGKVKGYFGTYQKTITVKIDSWFVQTLGFGQPSYEKLYERIHIPTSKVFQPNEANFFLAHELFHRIQAEYYGKAGMKRSANQWWLEATADYAAYQIAFNPPIRGIDNGIGNDYLRYPVDKTGLISKTNNNYGWSERDYEYITSIWIKYLVDSGCSLKQMIINDASDYPNPIKSLERYLFTTQKKSLAEFYRDFSHLMMFSPEGALNKYPFTTKGGSNDRDIAVQNNTLRLGTESQLSYTFEMPHYLTSHLWGITLEKNKANKTIKKSPVIIEVKDKTSGLVIDVFLILKGSSYPTNTKPIKTFYTDDKSKIIMVEDGEILCIVATQGNESGGSAEVIVSDANVILEIDPSELPNVKAREANYFTITAKNIPEEIKKVNFEWNYNDGSEKGIHDFVPVSNGEAQQKISHSYEESDEEEKYILKAILKDANNDMILAEAEAMVTLPLIKPTVFIPESVLIGPPGATFDMEALASPENTYNFVWTVEGMAEEFTQTGKKSGIAPIISEEGEYAVTVKLFDMNDVYLSMASASISVQPDELDTKGIDGIVDIEDGKVKKVIYRCDKYYYGCNVGPAGTKMFENGLKEMEKMINDYTKQGRSKDAAKASKRLAKMKSDFQLEKDTTSCNCQRKRTPTLSYE